MYPASLSLTKSLGLMPNPRRIPLRYAIFIEVTNEKFHRWLPYARTGNIWHSMIFIRTLSFEHSPPRRAITAFTPAQNFRFLASTVLLHLLLHDGIT